MTLESRFSTITWSRAYNCGDVDHHYNKLKVSNILSRLSTIKED